MVFNTTDLGRFVGAILIISSFLALLTLLLRIWRIIKHFLVLHAIAFGGRHCVSCRNQVNKYSYKSLHLYAVSVVFLDEVAIEELYNFSKKMVFTDASIEKFRKVLRSYKYVFMYRDCLDGTLRGMFLMGLDRHNVEGETFTVIKIGLTFFRKQYRGGPLLYMAFQYHILKELLLHPRTPIYIIGKAFSYMSYLNAVKNFKSAYPRYDCPKIPAKEKRIMDEFGMSFANFEDTYDPETCVIKREHTKLRPHILPVAEHLMENPHVKYFMKLNPHWEKGHCLVTMAKVTWGSLLYFFLGTTKRALFRGKKNEKGQNVNLTKRKDFMTEKEFFQKSQENLFNAGTTLDGLFESDLSPDLEEQDGPSSKKPVSYTKTFSMCAGVDRIDEYSEMEIKP